MLGVSCWVLGAGTEQTVGKLNSFRDLNVYQELKRLHLTVHNLTLTFPKFETYELGSQMRRSSNSCCAILAEGWGSRHTNIYIESVNRAMGEARETQHHLDVACDKGYLTKTEFNKLDSEYEVCGRMLEALHQSLSRWQGTTRTGDTVREERAPYDTEGEWEDMLDAVLSESPNT